jgi:dihydrofolate synthase/folylpolyglutamate synthase
MNSSYQATVDWLFSKSRALSPCTDLQPMIEACRCLGNPERSVRCIHVAGTNGKGSVCTKVAHGLDLAGIRAGLFTSPHISSFRERIQVQGVMIPEEAVVSGVSTIRTLCPDGLSFFDITTLLAFLWFREQKVEIMVLETGIGGRLDATNVCHPDLSIITSISFDHTHLLGDTLEQITAEKAGIVREKTPLILGPKVCQQTVARSVSRRHPLPPIVQVEGSWEDFDEENSAIATMAMKRLHLPSEIIREAVQVRPPCRFQEVARDQIIKQRGVAPPAVIFDVAHNPDAIAHLLMKARATFPLSQFCFLVAVCADKDARRMLMLLTKEAGAIMCTESSSPRALPAMELCCLAHHGTRKGAVLCEADPQAAFAKAMSMAAEQHMPLIVTGTFFLMDPLLKSC